MQTRSRCLPLCAALAFALVLGGCAVSSDKDPAFIKLSKQLEALAEVQKATQKSLDNIYFEIDTLKEDLGTVKATVNRGGASPEQAQVMAVALKRVEELEGRVAQMAEAASRQQNAVKEQLAEVRKESVSAPRSAPAAASVAKSASAPARAVAQAPKAEPKPAGFYYQVRQGDTVHSVAKEHDISSAELCRMNRMPLTARLYAGQRIYIKSNG